MGSKEYWIVIFLLTFYGGSFVITDSYHFHFQIAEILRIFSFRAAPSTLGVALLYLASAALPGTKTSRSLSGNLKKGMFQKTSQGRNGIFAVLSTSFSLAVALPQLVHRP